MSEPSTNVNRIDSGNEDKCSEPSPSADITSLETASENQVGKDSTKKALDQEAAIKKVRQCEAEQLQEMPFFKKISGKNDIPEVHPLMRKVDFYMVPIDDDSKYDPLFQNNPTTDDGETVGLDDLLALQNKCSSIALVGRARSGKTTCSLRFEKKSQKFCIRLALSQLGSEKRTLPQMLLDWNYPSLDSETCKNAFTWIKQNQKDCCIILDGLDQVSWSFENVNVQQGAYDTPLAPQQLIANLMGHKFLPDVHLLLTSRPYALIPVPKSLRPEKIFRLEDLATGDMERVFSAAIGDETEKCWRNLNTEAPLLFELCHNPLLLTFLITSMQPDRQIKVTVVPTMTEMFNTLLHRLRHYPHWHSSTEHDLLCQKLSRLAYGVTKRCTVFFNSEDLKKKNLNQKEVQGLTISTAGYGEGSEKLFELKDSKLYFVHQTWQEYFAAFYLSNHMNEKDFSETVDDIIGDTKWLMVRRFLCGLLDDPPNQEKGKRKNVFFSALKKYFKIRRSEACHGDLLDVMQDLLECKKETAESFGALFPARSSFHDIELKPSAAHALGRTIASAKHSLESLDLHNCYPNHESLKKVCNGLIERHKRFEKKIRVLDLSFNLLKSDTVDTLCKVIPYVENKLLLCEAFDYGNGMEQPSCEDQNKLSEARTKCGNSI